MEQVRLGSTGLRVSRLCLGCMTYGTPAWRPWVLDEAASRPLIRDALEAGVTFFDTADVYSLGTSEEVLGRALRDFARRDQIVIATKVNQPVGPGANDRGLSRKHVLASIDASLRRLGTDHVDLYQIHRFDPDTPIDETLDALDTVVRSGRARYIGASSMFAWQFMKLLGRQEARGWHRFATMQNHLNLLYREEEREMLPLCRAEGIGVLPWSPLARGLLAGSLAAGTARAVSDEQAPEWYGSPERDRIIAATAEVAAARGVAPAQVALAWVLRQPGVTAPIIGVSKPRHLTDALAALAIDLEPAEIARLTEPYRPRSTQGHR